MLAFQAPHLVYPLLGRHAPHIGRSDLSPKNHSWHLLELHWLIDSSDGLNMMSNHESFFKSFYFYLFKSFSFYQMISNSYWNLNFIFILSLILIFNLSTKWVHQVHSTIKWPCTHYLSCFKINSKPNLGASNTYNHISNLRTFQLKWF